MPPVVQMSRLFLPAQMGLLLSNLHYVDLVLLSVPFILPVMHPERRCLIFRNLLIHPVFAFSYLVSALPLNTDTSSSVVIFPLFSFALHCSVKKCESPEPDITNRLS